jgi:hypothetical protein
MKIIIHQILPGIWPGIKGLTSWIIIAAALLIMTSCIGTDNNAAQESAQPYDAAQDAKEPFQTFEYEWAAVTFIGEAQYNNIYPSYSGNRDYAGFIIPGEVIGICEWNIPKHNRQPGISDNIATSSTTFEEGANIYEWQGYDPSFRICGNQGGLGIIGQQRIDEAFYASLAESGATPAGLFGDFTDNVNSIAICGFNFGNEKGRIVDAAAIKQITDTILHMEYTEEAFSAGMQEWLSGAAYTINFIFANGFTETLLLYDSGHALFGGYLSLPGDIISALLDEVIIFTGEEISRNSLGRGYTTGMNFYDTEYDHTNHVLWEAYIDTLENAALYICRSMWFNSRYLVDPGPVSNLQRSGNYIYYLNGSGEIIRMMNAGVRDEGFLYERLEDGDDIRNYLEFEIVYSSGMHSGIRSFQIINKLIYFTDTDNILYRAAISDMGSAVQIAAGVSEYAPDEDAVTYISGSSLYRAYPDRTILLEEGGVNCFAPAMSKVYFSKGGKVFWISVAGGGSEYVFDIDASALIYTTVNTYTDGFVCIEAISGACKIVLINDDMHEFTIAESGAIGVGFFADQYFLLFTDDEIYRYSLGSYWEKAFYSDTWLPEYEQFLFDTKSDILSRL